MNIQNPPSRFIIIFFLVCILLVSGCQPQASATPTSAQEENPTATSAPATAEKPEIINANITLDPALTQDADSLTVSQYLYDGLVRLDTAGSAQPALAESWIISDDQLDYIFTLRPGAKFSDGSPITPDVVVNNFNRSFDKKDPLHKSDNFKTWESIFLGFNGEKDDNKRPKSPVDGFQKVDVNTVIIHLNRPVPDLLTKLANPAFAILNPAALADSKYGSQGSNIISSGAYVVSSWSDSGLTLAPNPNYWGTAASGDLNFSFP
jgi:peptide/nickel transport system substrate-binding protein